MGPWLLLIATDTGLCPYINRGGSYIEPMMLISISIGEARGNRIFPSVINGR
jgi:hypothetical protein